MYKHFCVVDSDGYYVTYVLTKDGEIFSYELKEGEELLDALAPTGMDKPRWDGGQWEETGTPPAPITYTPEEKRTYAYENFVYYPDPKDTEFPPTQFTDEPVAPWRGQNYTLDGLEVPWIHYASEGSDVAVEIETIKHTAKDRFRTDYYPDEV
jgi:hypothetical protein